LEDVEIELIGSTRVAVRCRKCGEELELVDPTWNEYSYAIIEIQVKPHSCKVK